MGLFKSKVGVSNDSLLFIGTDQACRTPAEEKDGATSSHKVTTYSRIWPGAVCCGLYLAAALETYGLTSLGPRRTPGLTLPMDSVEQIWWLAWAAHAFPHVHEMFLAQGQNYPFGQNFGSQGSMLALGILFLPITKVFGPIVSWNILLRLSIAASAASMCFVLRRWTKWWPAAFFGGLLYAFCGYMSWLNLYPFLVFVALPPVIFLFLHEMLIRQEWRAWVTGLGLGAVCVVQFFISTEVLAGTVVMGAIATGVILVVGRKELAARWRYAITSLSCAVGVICVMLAYPLWFTFLGPQHINGAPHTVAYWAQAPVDLLSVFVHGDLDHGLSFEWGGLVYLGWPLAVLLAVFAVVLRKNRRVLFASAMAVISTVLSLGPRLWVNGHETPVPLPSVAFEHLPVLDGFQLGRFALFTAMFAAGALAIGLEELWSRLRGAKWTSQVPRSWGVVSAWLVVGVVVLAVALPLVPRNTRSSTPTSVPTFFSSDAVRAIPPGSVVLAYPYPFRDPGTVFPPPNPMLYQAVSGMRFKLLGGYGYFPSPSGQGGTTDPADLPPQSVQAFFDSTLTGKATPAEQSALRGRSVPADLRQFLRTYDVETVLVIDTPSTARLGPYVLHLPATGIAIATIRSAIGPAVQIGGVTAWFHVGQRLKGLDARQKKG